MVDWVINYVTVLGINVTIERPVYNCITAALLKGLPPGWSTEVDEKQRVFFWNEITGDSSWQHPDHDIFEATIDLQRLSLKQQSCCYFFREVLSQLETQPMDETSGWSGPYTTDEGQSYWYNRSENRSVWQDPIAEVRRRHTLRKELVRCLLNQAEGKAARTAAVAPAQRSLSFDSKPLSSDLLGEPSLAQTVNGESELIRQLKEQQLQLAELQRLQLLQLQQTQLQLQIQQQQQQLQQMEQETLRLQLSSITGSKPQRRHPVPKLVFPSKMPQKQQAAGKPTRPPDSSEDESTDEDWAETHTPSYHQQQLPVSQSDAMQVQVEEVLENNVKQSLRSTQVPLQRSSDCKKLPVLSSSATSSSTYGTGSQQMSVTDVEIPDSSFQPSQEKVKARTKEVVQTDLSNREIHKQHLKNDDLCCDNGRSVEEDVSITDVLGKKEDQFALDSFPCKPMKQTGSALTAEPLKAASVKLVANKAAEAVFPSQAIEPRRLLVGSAASRSAGGIISAAPEVQSKEAEQIGPNNISSSSAGSAAQVALPDEEGIECMVLDRSMEVRDRPELLSAEKMTNFSVEGGGKGTPGGMSSSSGTSKQSTSPKESCKEQPHQFSSIKKAFKQINAALLTDELEMLDISSLAEQYVHGPGPGPERLCMGSPQESKAQVKQDCLQLDLAAVALLAQQKHQSGKTAADEENSIHDTLRAAKASMPTISSNMKPKTEAVEHDSVSNYPETENLSSDQMKLTTQKPALKGEKQPAHLQSTRSPQQPEGEANRLTSQKHPGTGQETLLSTGVNPSLAFKAKDQQASMKSEAKAAQAVSHKLDNHLRANSGVTVNPMAGIVTNIEHSNVSSVPKILESPKSPEARQPERYQPENATLLYNDAKYQARQSEVERILSENLQEFSPTRATESFRSPSVSSKATLQSNAPSTPSSRRTKRPTPLTGSAVCDTSPASCSMVSTPTSMCSRVRPLDVEPDALADLAKGFNLAATASTTSGLMGSSIVSSSQGSLNSRRNSTPGLLCPSTPSTLSSSSFRLSTLTPLLQAGSQMARSQSTGGLHRSPEKSPVVLRPC